MVSQADSASMAALLSLSAPKLISEDARGVYEGPRDVKKQRTQAETEAFGGCDGLRYDLTAEKCLSKALSGTSDEGPNFGSNASARDGEHALDLRLGLGLESAREGSAEHVEDGEPELARTACKPRDVHGHSSNRRSHSVSFGQRLPVRIETSGNTEREKLSNAPPIPQAKDAHSQPVSGARKRKAKLEELVLFWVQVQMQARAKTSGSHAGSPTVSPPSKDSEDDRDGLSSSQSPATPDKMDPPRAGDESGQDEGRKEGIPTQLGANKGGSPVSKCAAPGDATGGSFAQASKTLGARGKCPSEEALMSESVSPRTHRSLQSGCLVGSIDQPSGIVEVTKTSPDVDSKLGDSPELSGEVKGSGVNGTSPGPVGISPGPSGVSPGPRGENPPVHTTIARVMPTESKAEAAPHFHFLAGSVQGTAGPAVKAAAQHTSLTVRGNPMSSKRLPEKDNSFMSTACGGCGNKSGADILGSFKEAPPPAPGKVGPLCLGTRAKLPLPPLQRSAPYRRGGSGHLKPANPPTWAQSLNGQKTILETQDKVDVGIANDAPVEHHPLAVHKCLPVPVVHPAATSSFDPSRVQSAVAADVCADLVLLDRSQGMLGTHGTMSCGLRCGAPALGSTERSRSKAEKRRRERINATFADLKLAVKVSGDMAHVLSEAAKLIRHQQQRLEEAQEKLMVLEVRSGIYKNLEA